LLDIENPIKKIKLNPLDGKGTLKRELSEV
jgi:hypothetical protein